MISERVIDAGQMEAAGHAASRMNFASLANFDLVALAVVIGVLGAVLPPISATLAIVYYLVKLWENETVRRQWRRLRVWWRRYRA